MSQLQTETSTVSRDALDPQNAAHGSHEHHAHGPAHLAHHFTDSEQQLESAKLGMWVFLVTEVMLFGGIFCFYAIYRAWYPEMFMNAHHALNVQMGAFNTVALITSSLTMALAIRDLQLNQRESALMNLLFTVLLAGVFLVVKYFEYEHKIHVGQLPGKYFAYLGGEEERVHEHYEQLIIVLSSVSLVMIVATGLVLIGAATLQRIGSVIMLPLATVLAGGAMYAWLTGTPPEHGEALKWTTVLAISALVAGIVTGLVAMGGMLEKTEQLVTLAIIIGICVALYFALGAYARSLLAEPSAIIVTEPIQGANPHIFFSIYFASTGLHALHILIGMSMIIWVMIRTWQHEFSSAYYTPVEIAGLYWHLVDLIWIFLFPLLYLIG